MDQCPVSVVPLAMFLFIGALGLRRSLSTATHFSLRKVNFESASKVVPNDCNDMFWCISITNNVKTCKKLNEKAQTGKITVFTMVNELLKIVKYYTPSRGGTM